MEAAEVGKTEWRDMMTGIEGISEDDRHEVSLDNVSNGM